MEQYQVNIQKEELAPGVVVYKDVIPGHHQLIPYIEQMIDGGMAFWITTEISGNQVKTMSFPYPQQFKDPNDFSVTFEERISLVTAGFLGFVETDYLSSNSLNRSLYLHDQIGLMKYEAGTAFPLNDIPTANSVIIMYFLNDDYSGSTLEFSNLGVTYQPKENEALVFLAKEGLEYSLSELTEGTKYAIITYLRKA